MLRRSDSVGVVWLVLTGLVGMLSPTIQSQAQCQLDKTIGNPTPGISEEFAISVGISENLMVIGADRDDTMGVDAGAAYVYETDSGSLLHTLHNPSPVDGDLFGLSVGISGDYVIVGSPEDDAGSSNSGAAYLFNARTGELLRSFFNPSPSPDDKFGQGVAISGVNVLIGAIWDDTGASDAGSAYLFNAVTGALLWTFNNPDPAPDDRFGGSVAISGNTAVIGAFWDSAGADKAGSAYLFDAGTGSFLRAINNPSPADQDLFGISVAIWKDRVLVGASQEDTGATDAGTAYLFDAGTGALLHNFINPAPTFEDRFGYSVAISGDTVLIGAPRDDSGATDTGSACLFDAATGQLVQTFQNPNPAPVDFFGVAVAVSGKLALVGADLDDAGAASAGTAYLYACPLCSDFTGDGQLDVADVIHQLLGRL